MMPALAPQSGLGLPAYGGLDPLNHHGPVSSMATNTVCGSWTDDPSRPAFGPGKHSPWAEVMLML